MALTIGIDIGGTKIDGGVVEEDGTILVRSRRETPAGDSAKLLETIVELIDELTCDREVAGVGVGAAGWFDRTRTRVLFAPHLVWRDEPLRDQIAARTHLPVAVENDGNVAAWAEFRYGAAREARDSMVLVTIGTGIGGGIVIGGQLVRGANGIAGEPGHARVVPDGHPCPCGRKGCLEQYASGSALVRFARAKALTLPASASILLDLAAGDVAAINGPLVTRAAQAGDSASIAAFAEVGRFLGSGLADIVQILDPEVLVVGGGVVEAGELLLAPTREAYVEELAARGSLPVAPVVAAQLLNTAGVVGAADLVRG